MNTFTSLLLSASLLAVAAGARADSVYEWGRWATGIGPEDCQAQLQAGRALEQLDPECARQAIRAGGDPSRVTAPSAAGPGANSPARLQPVVGTQLGDPHLTQEGLPKEYRPALSTPDPEPTPPPCNSFSCFPGPQPPVR